MSLRRTLIDALTACITILLFPTITSGQQIQSVALNPTTVVGGSIQTFGGTVFLDGPALAPTTVHLTGGAGICCMVPNPILIPTGANQGTFTMGRMSSFVTGPDTVSVTAYLDSGQGQSATLHVQPDPLSVTVTSQVVGGDTIQYGGCVATPIQDSFRRFIDIFGPLLSYPDPTIPAGGTCSRGTISTATVSVPTAASVHDRGPSDGVNSDLTVLPEPGSPTPTDGNTPDPTGCDTASNGDGNPPKDGIDPSPDCIANAPINLANGNTYIQQNDYSLPGGRGGLSLTRTWHSQWQALLGTDSGAPPQSGMFGNGWISTYEHRINVHTVNGGTNGRKVWLAGGNSSFFSYNGTSWTPAFPLRLQASLGLEPITNTYTYTHHNGTRELFNQTGYLTYIYDRNGNNNPTMITYDGQNRITQVTDPVGRWIKFDYTDSHNPNQTTRVYDIAGDIASYQYSQDTPATHRLLKVTYADSPLNTVVQFQYNDSHSPTLISAVVDGAGKIIEQHQYDDGTLRRGTLSAKAMVGTSGNPVDQVTVAYSPTANTVTLTNSRNYPTTYKFLQFGNQNYLRSASGPGCSTCSIGPSDPANPIASGYNSDGTLTSRTSGRNSNIVDFYTYDPNKNLASKSQKVLNSNLDAANPIGFQIWQYTYNSFGEMLTATDPLGFVTTYQYDTAGHGNLTDITTPSPDGGTTPGSHTQFTVDTNTGLVTAITDPDGHPPTQISYVPDPQKCTNQTNVGLVASVTNGIGKTTKYCYDQRGNRTDVYDALGRHTHFDYDGRNRLKQITYPDMTTMTYTYEATRGRLQSVTDRNGVPHVTTYGYDDADRLTSVTDAQSPQGVTQYGYDSESNLTSIQDALGHTTGFVYDPANHLQRVNFPVNGSTAPFETYSIDAVGNLTSKTDRKNQTIGYFYDSLNRLSIKKWNPTSPTYTVNYHYDMNNRLTSVADPDTNPATGTYGFSYDNMNRLTQTTTAYSFLTGHTFTLNYGYDANSNRQTMSGADLVGTTAYTYDNINRLQNITDFNGNSFDYVYDDINRLTTLTRHANNVVTTYGYKTNTDYLASVLHQLGGTTVDGAIYTVDNMGNRLSRTGQPSGPPYTYTYDNIYQLKTVNNPSLVENYTYDLVGNRLTDVSGRTYTYNNPWNHLDSAGSTTYGYDDDGNLSSIPNWSYTWDFENRLTSAAAVMAGGANMQYDPFGRRIQLSLSPAINNVFNYVYDGSNVIEELDYNGNVAVLYSQALGVDQPLSMTRGGVTSYYEADGLGSITSLTNTAGAVTDTYAYDSFGNVTASSGTTDSVYKYAGREYNSIPGLYYYRARYYNSLIGRFISEDPIGFGGGIDFYPYAGNNPATWTDPSGLFPPLRPPFARTRPCNAIEETACGEICAAEGKTMENCMVSQTFRAVRAKVGPSGRAILVQQWVDGPMSCSCNEPPTGEECEAEKAKEKNKNKQPESPWHKFWYKVLHPDPRKIIDVIS